MISPALHAPRSQPETLEDIVAETNYLPGAFFLPESPFLAVDVRNHDSLSARVKVLSDRTASDAGEFLPRVEGQDQVDVVELLMKVGSFS